MSENVVILIKDLQVKYDGVVTLDQINMQVGQGEILGFLGPSGSGKTTLVKAIIGMKEASSGGIWVLGHRMPSLEIIGSLGYMAQSDALYEDLSALDNLLFFGAIYGLRGKMAKSRAMDVLTLVSLEKEYKKLVKKYSGGMKRRLSLAIALLHEPGLLILDEPTVGIDPVLRRSFWEEFGRIKRGGGTIIVTTHVMDEACKCDRLALIREGKMIASGSPASIIESSGRADLEEAFLFYSQTTFSKESGGKAL